MITDFETKRICNGVSFQRSDRLSITEREIHAYHEILFCLDTDAVLLTENGQKRLQGNVLLLIPKGTYHFFRIQDRDSFSRLKIYFPADVLAGTPCGALLSAFRIMENMDGELLFLLKKLCRFLEEESGEKRDFYIYSTFLMLLSELDQRIGREQDGKAMSGNELKGLLQYIGEHLSADLSVEVLAKKMHASPSAVTHLFKKTLGISLHRYVTQRRLIYGQNLILAGGKPSKIYSDCGYQDYSSFYKAYVLFFGYPPSAEGKEKSNI